MTTLILTVAPAPKPFDDFDRANICWRECLGIARAYLPDPDPRYARDADSVQVFHPDRRIIIRGLRPHSVECIRRQIDQFCTSYGGSKPAVLTIEEVP